jgi:hypothetical protein
MEVAMRNHHSRVLPVPAAAVAPLLDALSGPDDVLWPAPAWPPLRFDRPLGIGADGGHGPVRYEVAEYVPGQRLRLLFTPAFGIDGYHELRVEPVDTRRCRVAHDLIGTPRGLTRLTAPLVYLPLHDALIEDLLDNAERLTTGRVARPARWSRRVRLLRAAIARTTARPRAAATAS